MHFLKITFVVIVLLAGTILIIQKKNKKKHRKIWKDRYEQENSYNKVSENKDISPSITDKNNILLKVQMYLISLWLLLVLLIPITVKLVPIDDIINLGSWKKVFSFVCLNNIFPIISILMALIGIIFFRLLEYRWKGTRLLPVKVTDVESENFEYLTFLTTYIIPLVCINLDETRYIIVFFILLVIIGLIFVRSDFYLGNPTLALMNYKLYRIHYQVDSVEYERMIITRDKIQAGDYVEAIPFDQNAWYVRRSK